MAFKEFQLTAELPVKIYKRRASRSLRLSVTATGEVRVTIPAWTPYSSGLSFAASRLSWIQDQLPNHASLLRDGLQIGKAHHLRFSSKNSATKPSVRILSDAIVVSMPPHSRITDKDIQAVAQRGCIRALRLEAERLLPIRLSELATKHNFNYRSVSIRQLKSRWGSCDQHQNITLNLFLMQLPWDSIDYVLLHELLHTRVMQHGPKFWSELEAVLPSSKQARRTMRGYQPILHANAALPVA